MLAVSRRWRRHGKQIWVSLAPAWLQPRLISLHRRRLTFRREGRLGPRILAVRKDNFKLVINFATGCDQLFDLHSDPAEMNPLPANAAVPLRKELLERAHRHVAESRKSRDFDRRHAMLLRDLRLEWAHSAPRNLEN